MGTRSIIQTKLMLFLSGVVALFGLYRHAPKEVIPEMAYQIEPIRPGVNESGKQVFKSESWDIALSERDGELQSLRESEERYRKLVELSPEAIIVHSEGKIVYVNSTGASLFGAATPEELLGNRILDLIHADDRELLRTRINRIYTEGTKSSLQEYRIVRLNREIVDIEAKGTLVSFQGKPANLVILRNITLRKKAMQDLEALNKRLQEEQWHRKILSKKLIDLLEKDRHEVAMELHDHIGQLLTSLKTDLEIISTELVDADTPLQARLGCNIRKTAQVINDLKKISRGLIPGIIENLGLIPSLRALFDDIQASNNIAIYFFSRGLSKRLNHEKELALYRVAQESLTNVIKYAQARYIYVNLIKKRRVISLSIEDDGVGFETGKAMRISQTKGHLGLHIMQERAIQLGGEFLIESRKGEGTHVLVELPL